MRGLNAYPGPVEVSTLKTVTDDSKTVEVKASKAPQASGGSPVYGMGVIGASVYFWRASDTPRGRALGLAKGLVWPAFLVYEAFSAVSGRPGSARTE